MPHLCPINFEIMPRRRFWKGWPADRTVGAKTWLLFFIVNFPVPQGASCIKVYKSTRILRAVFAETKLR